MKIIHVIPNLLKGGAERIALNICAELHAKNEHEVLLITFQSDNAYSFLTASINWKVIPSDVVPSISGKPIITISELQTTIEEFQPDIIHAHLFKSMMVLSQVDYPKAHYFMHFHDNIPQLAGFSLRKILQKEMWTNLYEKRMLYRAFSKWNVSAISISNDTSRFAQLVLPKGIEVYQLLNAIDRKRFFSKVTTSPSNRLVMIGSFVEKKNQLLAIQTIQELASRGINAHLDLVGDGTMRQELENYIVQHELSDRIVFHGTIDSPETILSRGLIYLHTAKIEPFGLVFIEAMAAGLPVVCTDGGGNRDLIIEGENGFMVQQASADLLADKIEYLIKHPEKRMEMGRKAQEFSERFDIELYVEKLVSLYRNSVSSES